MSQREDGLKGYAGRKCRQANRAEEISLSHLFMLSLQRVYAYMAKMKKMTKLGFLAAALVLNACSGEDRSGERPLAPAGVTAVAVEMGDSCILKGHVGESHNSPLTKCGFYWGNDTLHHTVTLEPDVDFMDTVTAVGAGRYYAVAYAVNYIGATNSDTVYFYISR